MIRADKQEVSKRTIQNDINTLEADYGIMLDEKLKRGRQRPYRYRDTTYTLPLFRMNDQERNKIQDAISVLEDFEGDPMLAKNLWAFFFASLLFGVLIIPILIGVFAIYAYIYIKWPEFLKKYL